MFIYLFSSFKKRTEREGIKILLIKEIKQLILRNIFKKCKYQIFFFFFGFLQKDLLIIPFSLKKNEMEFFSTFEFNKENRKDNIFSFLIQAK